MGNITSAIDVLRDHQQHFLNRKLARSPLLQFFTGAYRLDIHRLFEHITTNVPAIKGHVGVSTPTAFLKNMLEGRLEAVIHNIPSALIKKLQKIQTAHIDNLNARGQHTLYLAYPCMVLPDEEKKSPKLAPVFLFKIDISINDVQKVVIKRVTEANEDGTEKVGTSAVFNRLLAAYIKSKHQVDLSFDSEKLSFNGKDIENMLDGVLQNWNGLNKTFKYPNVSKVPDKKSIKHLNIDKDDPYIEDCALIGIAEFSGQETLDDLDKIIKQLETGEECPQVLNSLIGIAQNNQSLEGREPKSDREKWLIEKSDPSQEKVIWTHRENLLTVLQGPPGTGKSQTIVNLIADALAQKKSVLVVCQKRAAIDVVLKRLSAKGLKDLAILVEDVDKDRQPIIKNIRSIEREISSSSDKSRIFQSGRLEQLEIEIERNIQALNDDGIGNRIRYKHIKARLSKLPKPTRHVDLAKFRSKVAEQSSDNSELDQLIQQIKQLDDTIKETDYVNNAWRDVKVTLPNHPKDLDDLIEFAKEVKELSDWILTQEIKLQYTKDTHWVMAHPWLVTGDLTVSLHGFLAEKENQTNEVYGKFCELINKLQIISKHNPQIKALDYVDKICSPDTQWSENLKKLAHDAGYLRQIFNLRNQVAKNEMLRELHRYGVKHGVNFGGWTEQIKAEALQKWLNDLREKHSEAFREIGDTKTKIQYLKRQLDEKRILDAKMLEEQFNERLTYRNQLENSNLLRLRRGGNVPKTSLRLLYSNGFEKLKNIAPLLLTSPEAASALLPLKVDLFDVVVIDEASQMFVAEAIPILFRAKKVLIAGDSKQMPPSDFFANATDDGGDVEWEDQEDHEDAMPQHIAADRIYTLLDAAENALPAGGHSRVSLDVHYRSARRELIDFSNHAFYDGKMIIPSGNAKLPSFMHSAIVFEDVQGKFEKGVNHGEATKIIELLKNIWKIPPKERPSVGVIVANTRQRDYVEDLLIDACERDNYFRRELDLERERTDSGENVAFFVRSVEHVQGDERDVIIFGLTYSGDSRAFGPLNKKEDGRKRLNVAITRAKRGMIVLNSLNVFNISNEAERNASERYYVWQYLRYAQAVSNDDIETTEVILNQLNQERKQIKIRNAQTESPFEDDVKEYIESLGYHVDCQVGESGFRIDLCVKRQATSAVYLCGIECDGAAYHTGWKARTRDVWRQEILESKGWHIERIWSTDWFDNTDTAKQALKEKLQELADIAPEKIIKKVVPQTNNKPTEKAAFRDATVTTQKEVEVGDSVTYQFANDAVTRQVKIVQGVGDPNQGTTNHKTPLAQALLGCKEGDVTVFLSPFGEKEIRIIAITKDEKF